MQPSGSLALKFPYENSPYKSAMAGSAPMAEARDTHLHGAGEVLSVLRNTSTTPPAKRERGGRKGEEKGEKRGGRRERGKREREKGGGKV